MSCSALQGIGGLRGEEIVKLDLFGLRAYFVDGKSSVPSFVPITLIGKFKGGQGLDITSYL